MGINDLIKEAGTAAHEKTATTRVYVDLSAEANANLERLAAMASKTKKGLLEWLINNAVEEFNAKEKETKKRARKG